MPCEAMISLTDLVIKRRGNARDSGCNIYADTCFRVNCTQSSQLPWVAKLTMTRASWLRGHHVWATLPSANLQESEPDPFAFLLPKDQA